MTVGNRIRAVDYNQIQAQVSAILGTGSGNFGYGQTLQSSQVNLSNKVTINEWANLRNDIISCYLHINNAAPSITQAAENALVRSNPTNSPYTQYISLVDVFNDDAVRLKTPPRTQVISFPTQSTTWPGIFGDYWRSRLVSFVTLGWSTADAARHFFNTGGEIRFFSARTGGANTDQNGAWTAMLTSAGTQAFGGRTPGTGTGQTQSLNGTNFYRLSGEFQTWYSITSSAPYGANSYSIQARAFNAPNNNNSTGGANIIQFAVLWFDDFSPSAQGNPDRVDGTISLSVSALKATSFLLGDELFAIETPEIVIGRIQPVASLPDATYQVIPRATSVNEGSTAIFDIVTTNVPNGTTMYWQILPGPNVTANDFLEVGGSFQINNNSAVVSVGIAADYETEGQEFFYLEITTAPNSGIVGTSRAVFINDTTFTFFFEITGNNTNGVDLRSRAIQAGWDQVQRLECQVRHNARCIGSSGQISQYNGTDSPIRHRAVSGMEIGGSFPNGLILRNNGTLAGRGGTGGAGGIGSSANGNFGGPGGPGLVLLSNISTPFLFLINRGRITGGGGGGGGGAGVGFASQGGGGGGGAPLGLGSGQGGANGTVLVPGSGGNPDNGFSQGGGGGSFAEGGQRGNFARPFGTGGGASGGSGGLAIVGSNLITGVEPAGGGDISGPIIGAPALP